MNNSNKFNSKTEVNDNLKVKIEELKKEVEALKEKIEELKKEVEALKEKLATSSDNDEETEKNYYPSAISYITFLIGLMLISTFPAWYLSLVLK